MYEFAFCEHTEALHQRQGVCIEALKRHNVVDGLRVRGAQHDVKIHH